MENPISVEDNEVSGSASEPEAPAPPPPDSPLILPGTEPEPPVFAPLAETVAWMNFYSGELVPFVRESTPGGKVLLLDDRVFDGDVWFIGDVHGDLRALAMLDRYIRDHSGENFLIVILGDVIDRHDADGGLGALRYLITRMMEEPGHYLWLCGNHDQGLNFDPVSGEFTSTVVPAEMMAFLNLHPEYAEFGRSLIAMASKLPRAVIFPDGLLAVHGAVPHSDVSASINTLADLENPPCLSDFTWGRLVDKREKYPNRASRGHEVGKKNFDDFCERMKTALGIDIRGIVFGHQHLFTDGVGFAEPGLFQDRRALCLYSSFSLDPAAAWGTERCVAVPCAAKHSKGGFPAVVGLELPPEEPEEDVADPLNEDRE